MAGAAADKYRGAVVEVSNTDIADWDANFQKPAQDLQLPPAFTLPREEPILAAIELAYDRDFSHIP